MRNNKKMILLSILALILVPGCLQAEEYTISSAAELDLLSLQPGDKVIMSNGTWTDQQLVFEGTGTSDQPILLQSETQGEVILNGSSTLKIYGEYLIVDGLLFKEGALSGDHVIAFRTGSSELSHHCRLTNTKIIDYNPGSDATAYKWVSIYGTNNRVDHCEFSGKNHEGALLTIWLDRSDDPAPNYHRIDHNYFGPISELGRNGAETIRIGTSDYSMQESRSLVEYNLFEACDGEIEIISNKSCFNTYRYNTFRNNEGGLTLRHGNDCDIYGNFFFGGIDKRSSGIRIIGEDHRVYNNYIQDMEEDGFRAAISLTNGVPDSPLNRYFQVKNAQVINNTIVNCKYPFVFGAGESSELSLPPLNTKVANNVIARYSGSMSDMITYEDSPIGTTYLNNMFYGGNLGISPEEGIELTDPLLVESDFYRPSSESPVIGSGSTVFHYFVSLDIDGQARQQEAVDVGCDQISEEETINHPLLKEDVGVSDPIVVGISASAEKFDSLTAYPNPNMGEFMVETREEGTISLLNANGALVNSFETNGKPERINLKDKPPGIYLIRFQSGNRIVSGKILVNSI